MQLGSCLSSLCLDLGSISPRKTKLVVSHPSAYKNSVRGRLFIFRGQRSYATIFTGVKLGYKRRVKGETGTTQVKKE